MSKQPPVSDDMASHRSTKKHPKIVGPIRKLYRRYKAWHSGLKRPFRYTYNVALFLAILLSVHTTVESMWVPLKNPLYGVSFSYKYANELGNDWQANYIALLDDLQIRNFRLMSYWDLHETERGKFDFSVLDWQMDEAAKRGAKVSLSMGLRQPRWPECHEPSWAEAMQEESTEWRQALYAYIEVVTLRYKDHPALQSYQLENEAVNNWFGTCSGAAPRDRLFEEYALIKKLDPNTPLWMSLSDQHGFPVRVPNPDAYGFSVYRTVWNDKGPINFYLTYPTPIWYHRIRKLLVEHIHNRKVFIHELQIEPWAPTATKNATVEEQEKSMDAEQIKENFDFARKIGAPEIYTWGGEWWYWRKTQFNDPGPWEIVRSEFAK
jgi:beta-galactosidase GanA